MNLLQFPWSAPLIILPKKCDLFGNPRYRPVIFNRSLNKRTIEDAYALPNISDILDQLHGSKYFSTFDLAHGFYQISLKPENRYKTALSTPGYRHYQFCKLPMGLSTSPAMFERLIETALRGLTLEEILVYPDDILVHSKSN